MLQDAIICLVLLQVGQIIWRPRRDDVISNHDRPLLYHSILLQFYEIRQVQVFHMVNENEVVRPILLYRLLQSAYCPNMNVDSLTHSCSLLYFPCDLSVLGADFNRVNGRSWYQLREG